MAYDPLLARIDALSGAFKAGHIDRRQFLKGLVGLGLSLPAIGVIVAACSSAASTPSPTAAMQATAAPAAGTPAATAMAASMAASMAAPTFDLTDLVTAAKAEGDIYQTGIPPEWVNYQGIFDLWKSDYGITIDGTATEGEYSSGQELDSIKNTGKPDVGDVGISFAVQAKTQGLSAPYKNSYWADIPETAKDADGYWCCNYWGAQAFAINTDAVKIPINDWSDLLDPSLKNSVGIDGDPTKANDSFFAVWSAALANGGGVDNIQPGIDLVQQAAGVGQPDRRSRQRCEHPERRSQGRHQVGLPRPGGSRQGRGRPEHHASPSRPRVRWPAPTPTSSPPRRLIRTPRSSGRS